MPRLDRGIQYAAAPTAFSNARRGYWIARSSRAMTAEFVAYKLREHVSV